MKHAGVAVTITSVTDVLAFVIGASTVIPALGSFCVYAGLGIFFIYLYQAPMRFNIFIQNFIQNL